jgi:hypothetical protein
VLFLVFAVTAYAGGNIIAFERMGVQVQNSLLASYVGTGGTLRAVLDTVSEWTHTTSVATRARSLLVKMVVSEMPGDSVAVEKALRELAAASPTSVTAWQALVAFHHARGDPIEAILPAFRMSALTGPQEEYFVKKRAMFGLEYWVDLPEADRRIVVRDLVSPIRHYWTDDYRRIVAGKSQAERDEVRTAVMASGRATKDLLRALGI